MLEPDEYPGFDEPCYRISVVSRLVRLHPQTIRQYERLGLLNPQRTPGRTRLYSRRDLERLRQIASLTSMGVNLAGVEIICNLLDRIERMRREIEALRGPGIPPS
ncbi:MAG TPA: MerR family transcriptional regulator [Candidatus Nitrosotenuis sp.]|jgi:MerR family transcriptional regulator/heat shock protein HspR|nr:MerR family transcriptional regulator [Candidatus Nitrosotenuis sp.]